MTKPDDPAFSQQFVDQDGKPSMCGLTKREWYAGLAMQGILSDSSGREDASSWAEDAVIFADALIAALNKPKP